MHFRFYKTLLLFGDGILLILSLYLMVLVGFWNTWNPTIFWSHASVFIFLYPFWLIVFYVFDLYDLSMPTKSPKFFSMVISALTVAFLLGVLYFYVIPSPSITPKINLLIHLAFFGVLFIVWRFVFFRCVGRRLALTVGLFVEDDQSSVLKQVIEKHAHLGYQTVFISLSDDIQKVLFDSHIRFLVLPKDLSLDPHRIGRFYACLGMGVTFLETTQAFELFSRRIPISAVDQHWFLRNIQDREDDVYRFTKRFFDIAVASGILLTTFPAWLLIMLAIKAEDRGPVFYRQMRLGKGGKPFSILKFRTMRQDAEKDGVKWAEIHDARVTKVGEFLRATHLDELPQMIHVLKGDISLVGPRPERPEFIAHLEKEIPHYRVRLFVTPGFTGWAQIRYRYARSVMDSQTKFEYDLHYIKNRSFFFDVLILLKTFQLLFRREE